MRNSDGELKLWRAFVFRKAADMMGHSMACAGSKKDRGMLMRQAHDDAWEWFEGSDFEVMLSYADMTPEHFTLLLDYVGDAIHNRTKIFL